MSSSRARSHSIQELATVVPPASGVGLMRVLTLAAVASLVLCASASAPDLEAQAALKIGYVDSQLILQEAPGATEAQEEFDRQMERFSQEVENMGVALDSLVNAYQQQQSTLLANVRQARENEINQLQQRYQQRVDQMGQEAEAARQALIAPILNQMAGTIDEIREEGDYQYIFDLASQAIVAADTSLDLTQEVLLRMQQAAGVGGVSP